jgi:hypothetical protein
MKTSISAEKKIAGHESQGARRQDVPIGGKLPVVFVSEMRTVGIS